MNLPSSKPMHSANESAPLELIALDCDHILTHAGGDPELLIQLCCIFLNELPVRIESLRSGIKDRNRSLTERALQQLRNCLMVFGAGRIRQVQREWKCLDRQVQLLVPQVQRLMLEMATPKSAVQ